GAVRTPAERAWQAGGLPTGANGCPSRAGPASLGWRGGLDLVEPALNLAQALHELFLPLLAFAAVDDAELRRVANHVGGKGENPGENALVLERTEVERGEFLRQRDRFLGDR